MISTGYKKTLILGASSNPHRYSFLALQRLRQHQHPVVAVGRKKEMVEDTIIESEKKDWTGINTVTIYLNPDHQQEYYDYVISLKPKRIIFNPGTENEEFESLLKKHGIDTMNACTLVLLATGQY